MHYLVFFSDGLPIHNDIGKYRIKLWFEQVLNRKKKRMKLIRSYYYSQDGALWNSKKNRPSALLLVVCSVDPPLPALPWNQSSFDSDAKVNSPPFQVMCLKRTLAKSSSKK